MKKKSKQILNEKLVLQLLLDHGAICLPLRMPLWGLFWTVAGGLAGTACHFVAVLGHAA